MDQAISTTQLAPLLSSFCPMERAAMLRGANDLVDFHRERGPALARAYGLIYPVELAHLVSGRRTTSRPR